ncbi:CatA-like O-acetyltransferase [Bacteroides acidifaciens]|uniref:CatA-like O-acetyltransferase n=1 Tax=Bacteroides acidifaciens TaxID=85831 RepID=UPI0026EE364A|nr:CatA-like O-acetyltransferase [Bacteroides acidifaciens]
MGYRYLDMDTYKRKSHFEYFNSLAYPYVGLTVNVDITEALKRIRSEKWSFFFTVCYCVSKAANEVSEFRQRIINNKIAEFDHCKTSHTVALENGTYCYCTLDSNMPFAEYLPYASREQESAKQKKSIEENESDIYDKLFISTLPWLSYTALIQPVPIPADSNPRITWGKYFIQEGSVLMPVSVLCHHGLVDGIHIAEFYKQLDEQMRQLT